MDTTSFFDKFVSHYPIYQNNRVYKILIDKFKDVFIKDVYEDIPSIFKKLYEKNEIPPDVYDQLLVEIGVSNDLIKQLSNSEKLIFIKSLSDFQRYKSTVKLTEDVIRAYGNNIEAYELYLDYNKDYDRWECKPYTIYKPEYSDGYSRIIPYKLVYRKIPNLLIHEKQLTRMKELKLGIFPIKTNIVLITSNYSKSLTGYLQNLIVSVFRKYYRDYIFPLYFDDKLINCTLHQFILCWLYLLFVARSSNIDSPSGMSLSKVFFSENTPYTIQDLDQILEEYEEITTSTIKTCYHSEKNLQTKFDIFFDKYFRQFEDFDPNKIITDSVLDLAAIENILKIENNELILYIQDKINQGFEISFLLNSLISSLESYRKTTSDLDFLKYFKYFKSFLPSLNLKPSQSTAYKVLYYLKPYHTEFIDLQETSIVISDDKFNYVYFNHFYHNALFDVYNDVHAVDSFCYPLIGQLSEEFIYHHSFCNQIFGGFYLIDEQDIEENTYRLFSDDSLLEIENFHTLFGW